MKNRYFWVTCLCIFLVSFLNIGFLYQYADVIDAIGRRDAEHFIKQLLVMCLTIAAMLVFEYLRQIINLSYLNQVGFQLQSTLLGRLFAQDYRTYSQQPPGHYLSQFNNDLERIKDGYYDQFFTIFQGICSFAIASLALFRLDRLTAVFIILVSFLPVLIPYLFRNRMRVQQNALSEVQGQYNSRLSDLLSAFLTVKNVRQSSQLLAELEDRYQKTNDGRVKLNQTTVAMRLLVGLVFYSTTLLIICIGGWQVFAGSLTVGGLTAILTISEQLVDPINSVSHAFLERHALKDVKEQFAPAAVTVVRANRPSLWQTGSPALEAQKLCYSLKDQDRVQEVSYVFEQGGKYLISGQSGRGKTTLALLLTKNLQPADGKILLGGRELDDLSYQEVQDQIAYLPQETSLFQATVRYNLTLGAAFSSSYLLDLLALVGLDQRFPDSASLDELITDDSGLSGGQKQRLALVRALLQDKPILILDESLSGLDQSTFAELEAYLTGLPELTLLHISHRFSIQSLALYDGHLDLDNAL